MDDQHTKDKPGGEWQSRPVVILSAVIILLLVVVGILTLQVDRLRRRGVEGRGPGGHDWAATTGGTVSDPSPHPSDPPRGGYRVVPGEPDPPPVTPPPRPRPVTPDPGPPAWPRPATPDQITDAREGAKKAVTLGRLRQISTMVQAYIAENDRSPSRLDPLGLQQEQVRDGWGHAMRYQPIPPRSFRIVSAGRDGAFDTSDDLVCKDGVITKGTGRAAMTSD